MTDTTGQLASENAAKTAQAARETWQETVRLAKEAARAANEAYEAPGTQQALALTKAGAKEALGAA
eukprot:2450697-Prymnesium_polylepis.1